MRLIDADAMKADLLTIDPQYEPMIQWCITVLDVQPTAERTGEWKKVTKHHKDDKQEFDYYEITCSVCGSRPDKSWHLTAYCPNCGSRMLEEGGEDDE